jgi:hypothetical protein
MHSNEHKGKQGASRYIGKNIGVIDGSLHSLPLSFRIHFMYFDCVLYLPSLDGICNPLPLLGESGNRFTTHVREVDVRGIN